MANKMYESRAATLAAMFLLYPSPAQGMLVTAPTDKRRHEGILDMALTPEVRQLRERLAGISLSASTLAEAVSRPLGASPSHILMPDVDDVEVDFWLSEQLDIVLSVKARVGEASRVQHVPDLHEADLWVSAE